MHIQSVLDQLRALRMATMAEALTAHIRDGNSRDLSHEEFVALLVEEEFNARQNRKLSRMISRAGFKPEQASMENVIMNPTRGFQKRDLAAFATDAWIVATQNIVLTGPTGCGKTYLAEAIGYRACILGYPAIKIRYPRLFEEVHAAKGTGAYLRYLNKLAKTKVLIIDDFLMQPIEIADANALLEIIEEKDQTGSLILTTQFPIDKWHQRLPDPTLADAICDRIVHGAIKLHLDGESMRKEQRNPRQSDRGKEKTTLS